MRKIVYLTILILNLPMMAAAQEMFKEGKHYTEISVVQPVETGDKIEVRELFWYGCPHCFKLEDGLDTWASTMPDDAQFVRMPAIFSSVWEQHAKLYYTLEAMGELDTMHNKVFDAIHVHEQQIIEDDEMIEFAQAEGLDKAEFEDTLSSFTVTSKVSAAKANIGKYEVTGVPAVVVAGKYLTDVSSAGSEQALFQVLDFLINKSKAER